MIVNLSSINLSSVISGVNFAEIRNYTDCNIGLVTCDSRSVTQNTIFVAIKGEAFDGNDFILSAIEAGAVCIVVEHIDEEMIKNLSHVVILRAQDVRLSYSKMMANFFNHLQPRHVLAVTSTSGKSSIVDICHQIATLVNKNSSSLGSRGLILNKSQNNDFRMPGIALTTPDAYVVHSVLSYLHKKDIDILAMEASSHGLLQCRLHGVEVRAAAFDNISHEHLDYHKNIENYLSAKMKLFSEVLSRTGFAILNRDCKEFEYIKNNVLGESHSLFSYSVDRGYVKGNDADLIVSNRFFTEEGQGFTLFHRDKGKSYDCFVSLLGGFQVNNICAAIGLLLTCSISMDDIVKVIKNLLPVPGRMNMIGKNVILDYAHKPSALQRALEGIRMHFPSRRVKVLFGCGGERDRQKRPMMGRIASDLADEVIITDDNPRSEDAKIIRDEIHEGCGDNTVQIADRAKAIKYIIENASTDSDILLISGRGDEEVQVMKNQRIALSDREIIERYCQL